MKKTISGYVVVAPTSGPLELVKDEEHGSRGVLYCGNRVTVFRTRQGARAAIERTRKYAADKGLDYPWWTKQFIKAVSRKRE